MTIREFVENYKAKKFMSTKQGVEARSTWLKSELEIRTYIPFREKRAIAEMIVDTYTREVDGIQRHNNIDAYVGFVTASIIAHTNLEFSSDPVADYDLLSESGALPLIISEFQESYNEIDILLKMALAEKLEDNNFNVSVGRVLNRVSQLLDVVGDKIKNLDLSALLGSDITKENLAKLSSFLNTIK